MDRKETRCFAQERHETIVMTDVLVEVGHTEAIEIVCCDISVDPLDQVWFW